MSRADSGDGRRGRRGGRRADSARTTDRAEDFGPDEGFQDGYDPEEDFSAEYGHTHTQDTGGDADDGYKDEHQDDMDLDDDESGSAQDTGGSPGRRRRAGSRRSAPRRKSGGGKRGGVDRVSAFSASALKRVTGDRPNQIVYTLAEQSKRKRGTAVLGVLMGAFSIALVALLGLLSFQLVTGTGGATAQSEEDIVAPPTGHSTLTPELYLFDANREDVFGSINERPEGAERMTEEAVFSGVGEIGMDGMDLELRESTVTKSCTSQVWGEDLGQSLIDANCAGAATGVYSDSEEEHVAQVNLFDLRDSDSAADVAEALDPANADNGAGFLLPNTGDVAGLEEGYSQASTQVMGHYLAVFWVARTDGSAPGEDSDMATLSVTSMNAVRYVYEEVVEADRA